MTALRILFHCTNTFLFRLLLFQKFIFCLILSRVRRSGNFPGKVGKFPGKFGNIPSSSGKLKIEGKFVFLNSATEDCRIIVEIDS